MYSFKMQNNNCDKYGYEGSSNEYSDTELETSSDADTELDTKALDTNTLDTKALDTDADADTELDTKAPDTTTTTSDAHSKNECIICNQTDDLLVRLPCEQCNKVSIENIKWIHKDCLTQHLLTYKPNYIDDDDYYISDDDEPQTQVLSTAENSFVGSLTPKCPYCTCDTLRVSSNINFWTTTGFAKRITMQLNTIYGCASQIEVRNVTAIIWPIAFLHFYLKNPILPWWVDFLNLPNWIYYCGIFIIMSLVNGIILETYDRCYWLIRDIKTAKIHYHKYSIKEFKILYDEN